MSQEAASSHASSAVSHDVELAQVGAGVHPLQRRSVALPTRREVRSQAAKPPYPPFFPSLSLPTLIINSRGQTAARVETRCKCGLTEECCRCVAASDSDQLKEAYSHFRKAAGMFGGARHLCSALGNELTADMSPDCLQVTAICSSIRQRFD